VSCTLAEQQENRMEGGHPMLFRRLLFRCCRFPMGSAMRLTGISSGRAMAEPACLGQALHTEDKPIIFLYVSFYYDKVEAWF
jgi:hypothetical protein